LNQKHESLAFGELLVTPQKDYFGIPACTLSQLFGDSCHSLQHRSHALLPSLVREIRGATLTLSFCKAWVECTKCFTSLVDRGGRHHATNTGSNDTAAPSFWHNPLPIPNSIIMAERPQPTERPIIRQSTTRLCCPNKCSLNDAAIRWECSGVLDDGTGQAKLYADREAALMILGMSRTLVEQIEQGAWLNPGGIIYSKGIVPNLRMDVLQAQESARKRHTVLEERHVLACMTLTTRAIYLLQRHLRQRDRRSDLVYYVRAKPLSDKVTLNQTNVEASCEGYNGGVAKRDVATYSLPPLKLDLVDARVCSQNGVYPGL
jgi:hypothetical protein